jgi:NAD(P)H-hydrate repair Nnr-like enzyme with NAD(P)H-hydrate dehydratase domain
MESINWQRQTKDQPLFSDMLWSRPVNKRHAGKLLIIGGHSQSFAEPSRAYSAALKAGAGHIRIVLPDKLQKTLGKGFPEAEFAPSTPIGSFGKQALDLFLDLANWADDVLLAGGLSKNSETAILLESFVDKYAGQLSLTGDSLDYFLQKPAQIVDRKNTLIVGSIAQLQKLAQPQQVIRQNADLMQILNTLSIWTSSIKASVVTAHSNQIVAASQGKLSTSPSNKDRVEPELAAYTSVWTMQQPEKVFEALTTGVYCFGL